MNLQLGRSTLVISLDFELHWGVTERVRCASNSYNTNLFGARKAVPELLALFEYYGIHATWATVGMLFARGAEDLDNFKPIMRPAYRREEVDTYRIAGGTSEREDPLHFAPALIKKIQDVPGQEIGSHTFCHYYCDEPDQDAETFKADLEAAQTIAARDEVKLKSLVFPRNQVRADYLPSVNEMGLSSYRGNPPSGRYHLPASRLQQYATRATRLADSYINITGHHHFSWENIPEGGLANVQASHFLRPFKTSLCFLEPLRIKRVQKSMTKAAQEGGIFHLWWHPHNFGTNLNENLAALNEILKTFEELQSSHGMQSLNMAEAAETAFRLKG